MEKPADLITHPEQQQDFQKGGEQGGRAHARELPQVELQAERKHEQDDPQLREGIDGFPVLNEDRGRRVRADDDARNNVAQHHRLFEAVKDHRHQPGHNHYHRQVLQEVEGVHAQDPRREAG